MKNKYAAMSADELLNEENILRTEMFNLRIKNTTKVLEDTSKIRIARRNLARVLTALTARRKEASGNKTA